MEGGGEVSHSILLAIPSIFIISPSGSQVYKSFVVGGGGGYILAQLSIVAHS